MTRSKKLIKQTKIYFSKFSGNKLLYSQIKRPEAVLVVLGIFVGLLSAFLNDYSYRARERALEEKYETTSIYVAKRDLSPGTILGFDNIRLVHSLSQQVTANFITKRNVKSIIGKRFLAEIREGDPILLTQVDGFNSQSMALKIPPGKRLFSLQISDKVASNGWIKPNDRVDVIATMNLPGRGETTFTLLQDITLVSVGKSTVWGDQDFTSGSDISFFVTPSEMELLKFAQSKGDFSLALRNPNDVQVQKASEKDFGRNGIDMQSFLDSKSISKASGGSALPIVIKNESKKKGEG